MSRRMLIGLAIGAASGLVTAALAVASMGAGHGDYFLAAIFYPFAMIALKCWGEIPLTLACASLAQFPAYSVGIALQHSARRAKIATALILGVHGFAVALAL